MSNTEPPPSVESAGRGGPLPLRILGAVHLILMVLGLPLLVLFSFLHLFMTSTYEETMGYYLAGIGMVVGPWALGSFVGWLLMRALEVDGAPRYALFTLVVGTAVILAPHVMSIVTGIAG
ncbi:hypothetical protein [Nocardiopsis sp. FIRDI 009]|uniref:hypothetical protein n=1 Tax=Nocardiopsis sp. FIRDI 009 TaxID=714197 RepID=UPI000E25D727|nr:hypothetical protein [Nocardiopsis sp. FIRDI 009]